MTPEVFKRHKSDGSLEGAGVKVHNNFDYRDIFPSCDVYYLCCDDETTPTVSFPRQALLFRKLCVHWPEILALVAKKLMNVGARLVPSDALASLWAPDGDAAVVAAAMGSTADSATSFCLYVEMLVRRGMLTPPEAYPFPRRPEYAPGDVDVTNRRTSTTFGRDASEGYLTDVGGSPLPYCSDDDEGEDEESGEDDEESGEDDDLGAEKDLKRPRRPEWCPEGHHMLQIHSLVEKFSDELYYNVKKPQKKHYIKWGWTDPVVYVERFMGMLSKSEYADLVMHCNVSKLTDPRVAELRRSKKLTESDEKHLLRYEIETMIFQYSAHMRSYAAQHWGVFYRSHHVPLAARETLKPLHLAVSSQAVYAKRTPADRDAVVAEMIYNNLKGQPFSIAADNYQLTMASTVSQFRECSNFGLMLDCGAGRFETVAVVDAVLRLKVWMDDSGARVEELVAMTVDGPDPAVLVRVLAGGGFGAEKHMTTYYAGFWSDEEGGGAYSTEFRDAWMVRTYGESPNSGRFSAETAMPRGSAGEGKQGWVAWGAHKLNPDAPMGICRFLEYVVTLFANVLQCPRALPFGIVILFDEKTYAIAKKVIAKTRRSGLRLFECFLPVPGHWHAVKTLQEALLHKKKHLGWRLFRKLRARLPGANMTLTEDTFGREMTFADHQMYLGIMRAAWLRRRREYLEKARAEPANFDYAALVTYHDFLIPVTLDFIKVIKEAGPDAYLALLPKFMVALWITHSSNYYRAFSLWVGDLENLRQKLPAFYDLFMANLHRTVSEVAIEYQHKVLAAHSQNVATQGYAGVDKVITEWTTWARANDFVGSFGPRVFPIANRGAAYALVDAELDPKNAFAIQEYQKVLNELFEPGGRSTRRGNTIDSARLESYPISYLGGDYWCHLKL
jgi:hypothetical protein